MEDGKSQRSDSTNESNGSTQERSAAENIRDLTAASKQLLEAGKQITANLSELSQRVEHASNIGSRVIKSPWLIVAGAIAAGALLLAVSCKH